MGALRAGPARERGELQLIGHWPGRLSGDFLAPTRQIGGSTGQPGSSQRTCRTGVQWSNGWSGFPPNSQVLTAVSLQVQSLLRVGKGVCSSRNASVLLLGHSSEERTPGPLPALVPSPPLLGTGARQRLFCPVLLLQGILGIREQVSKQAGTGRQAVE